MSLKQENFKKCCGMIVYPKGSPKIAFEGKRVYMFTRKPNPMTKVWAVYNYCNEFLGEIRWKAMWRQYALKIDSSMFSSNSLELWFGGSCFREIANFCERETKLQKEKKQHG